MTEQNNQYRFDSVDLIVYLWNRRLPLIIITALAAVVSIIVSLSIEEKYKSEVILFPTASGSVSHDLLAINIAEKNILKLGEDEEVEQLLQVLNSDDIRDKVITRFNLMEHYGIDSSSKYPITKLHKEFEKNISFNPTKFMSVRIEVLDKDPQMAADIANNIGELIDTVMNHMQRERALEALALVEREYFTLQQQIKEQEDSLDIIRSFGVVAYESQAEVITDAYAQAIVKGNERAVKRLEEKLEVFAKYGGAYVSLRNSLQFEKKQSSELKAKYAEAVVDATQDLPNKFVVNNAFAAEKKSYPIRWLIVAVSTISSFILTILLLVIYDSVTRRLKVVQDKA